MFGAIGYTVYINLVAEKTLIKTGDTAPDFEIVDLQGKKHQLSNYRGKGVFLNFWGTYCPPCKKEMPYIEKQGNVYKDKNVVVLTVNVGEAKVTVESFAKQYGLTFPILIDKQSQTQTAYNINVLPATFLIDKSGKIKKIATGEMTEEIVANYMESIKP